MGTVYDAVIIGAGMSGLAAGIRLAHFGQKVLILEKHFAPGGLNSYYHRGARRLDVGLHALTNFARRGEKGRPLTKLLKQLRFAYDDLKLCEQTYSLIHFPQTQIKFSNDQELFIAEVQRLFPAEKEGFLKLIDLIKTYDEVNLNHTYSSAKAQVRELIKDPLLVEMIFAPVLIYGSAWENDMDFSQFVIMFKALYCEGFSRPVNGVKTIIDLLEKAFADNGGELRYRSGVQKIMQHEGKAVGVLLSNGEEIKAKKIFSSAGLLETNLLLNQLETRDLPIGPMSFTESMLCFQGKMPAEINQATIIFYNNAETYHYERAQDFIDPRSAVICFPDQYHPDLERTETMVRLTHIARFDWWHELRQKSMADYRQQKNRVLATAQATLHQVLPGLSHWETSLNFSDVFTPPTITRYTGHLGGAVYGSTVKSRRGTTELENLYIMGTDQGFLGIIGAMLSGISIANLYGLMES